MNKQGVLYTVLFSFLVSFAFVAVLAIVNGSTAERVARNLRLQRQHAILSAMGRRAETRQAIERAYADVEIIEHDTATLYRARIDGREVYAKEFIGAGLWGPIEGVLAVSGDFERAVGLEIVSHNETPGLGGRVAEEPFTGQFREERIVNATIVIGAAGPGDEDRENGAVDAITGASRTSDGMRVILDRELDVLAALIGASS